MRQTQSSMETTPKGQSIAEAKRDRQRFKFMYCEADRADKYLDLPSRTGEGSMYEIASDNPRETGGKKMLLLRCSIEDWQDHQNEVTRESQAGLKAVGPGERLELKSPISVEPE